MIINFLWKQRGIVNFIRISTCEREEFNHSVAGERRLWQRPFPSVNIGHFPKVSWKFFHPVNGSCFVYSLSNGNGKQRKARECLLVKRSIKRIFIILLLVHVHNPLIVLFFLNKKSVCLSSHGCPVSVFPAYMQINCKKSLKIWIREELKSIVFKTFVCGEINRSEENKRKAIKIVCPFIAHSS